jgi:hypothetical protein
MALQIPNAPQLESDPYARSRSGFNELLSVFKEQRALRQNAKLMAQKFDDDLKLETYRASLNLANLQAIETQRFQQDVVKLEMTAGIQNINNMYEQMNKKVEGYKKNFDGLDEIVSSFNPDVFLKPRFVNYVDPETGKPVIKGVISQNGQEIELGENEIESYYNNLKTYKPVADFIKVWKTQSGDFLEETTANRIGSGEIGRQFVQRLMNNDQAAIESVLDGTVTHNKKRENLAVVDKKIEKYTESRNKLSTIFSSKENLGGFEFIDGKLVADTYTGARTEIDFKQLDVIELLGTLKNLPNRYFDSISKKEVSIASKLAAEIESNLNDYIAKSTPEGKDRAGINEFFSGGNYYLDPTDFSIKQRSPDQKPQTTQDINTTLYQGFIKNK